LNRQIAEDAETEGRKGAKAKTNREFRFLFRSPAGFPWRPSRLAVQSRRCRSGDRAVTLESIMNQLGCARKSSAAEWVSTQVAHRKKFTSDLFWQSRIRGDE
jgi:hypothetical protein